MEHTCKYMYKLGFIVNGWVLNDWVLFSLGREVEDDVEDIISNAPLKSLDSKSVSDLLIEQLKTEKLALLSEKNLAETLTEFVDKQEKEALV